MDPDLLDVSDDGYYATMFGDSAVVDVPFRETHENLEDLFLYDSAGGTAVVPDFHAINDREPELYQLASADVLTEVSRDNSDDDPYRDDGLIPAHLHGSGPFEVGNLSGAQLDLSWFDSIQAQIDTTQQVGTEPTNERLSSQRFHSPVQHSLPAEGMDKSIYFSPHLDSNLETLFEESPVLDGGTYAETSQDHTLPHDPQPALLPETYSSHSTSSSSFSYVELATQYQQALLANMLPTRGASKVDLPPVYLPGAGRSNRTPFIRPQPELPETSAVDLNRQPERQSCGNGLPQMGPYMSDSRNGYQGARVYGRHNKDIEFLRSYRPTTVPPRPGDEFQPRGPERGAQAYAYPPQPGISPALMNNAHPGDRVLNPRNGVNASQPATSGRRRPSKHAASRPKCALPNNSALHDNRARRHPIPRGSSGHGHSHSLAAANPGHGQQEYLPQECVADGPQTHFQASGEGNAQPLAQEFQFPELNVPDPNAFWGGLLEADFLQAASNTDSYTIYEEPSAPNHQATSYPRSHHPYLQHPAPRQPTIDHPAVHQNVPQYMAPHVPPPPRPGFTAFFTPPNTRIWLLRKLPRTFDPTQTDPAAFPIPASGKIHITIDPISHTFRGVENILREEFGYTNIPFQHKMSKEFKDFKMAIVRCFDANKDTAPLQGPLSVGNKLKLKKLIQGWEFGYELIEQFCGGRKTGEVGVGRVLGGLSRKEAMWALVCVMRDQWKHDVQERTVRPDLLREWRGG